MPGGTTDTVSALHQLVAFSSKHFLQRGPSACNFSKVTLPENSKVSCHPDGQTLTRHPLLRHAASAVVYQNSEESHLRPDVSGSGLLGTREDFGLCSQPVFASGWWGEWGGGLRQPPWKCRLGKGGCLVPLRSRGPPTSLQMPQAAGLLPPRGPSLPLLPWASCSTGCRPPTRCPRLPSYSSSPQGTTLGPEENPVGEATSLGHCAISGCQRCHRQWGHTAAWERGPTDTKSQGRVSLTPATHPVPLRMLEATSHSGQHPGLKSSTSCLPVGQQLLPRMPSGHGTELPFQGP